MAGIFGFFTSMFFIEYDKFKTIFPKKEITQNDEVVHERTKIRPNESINNIKNNEINNNLNKNEVNSDQVKGQYDGNDPFVRKRLGLPPKDVSINKENEILNLTNEEIEEAERKAQYHGDDPIVRKRLGLPPKMQN